MSARLEKVWQAINPDRLRKTFLDLLDIYSPSGKEEDIQLYLEELLTRAGFSVERQEVDEDRYNLRVTMGPENRGSTWSGMWIPSRPGIWMNSDRSRKTASSAGWGAPI